MLLFKKVILFSNLKKICTKKFLQWKQQVSIVRTLSSTVCFDTLILYRSWALSSWGERRSWLFYIKQWHHVCFIRKFSLSWIPVNWETLTVHFVVQQASNLNLYSTTIPPISMSNIKRRAEWQVLSKHQKTLSRVIDVIMQQWKRVSLNVNLYHTMCETPTKQRNKSDVYGFPSLCVSLSLGRSFGFI